MKIPNERDWLNQHGDLDVASAREDFLDVTYEQAVRLFEENALRYQEGVVFMPFDCFTFYVHSYIDYLLSDASRGDADGASCFFTVVECRADDILKLPSDAQERIERVLDGLSKEQKFYDADESIYGNFADRVSELKQKRN